MYISAGYSEVNIASFVCYGALCTLASNRLTVNTGRGKLTLIIARLNVDGAESNICWCHPECETSRPWLKVGALT